MQFRPFTRRYRTAAVPISVTVCMGIVLSQHWRDLNSLAITALLSAVGGMIYSTALTFRQLRMVTPGSDLAKLIETGVVRTAMILFLAIVAIDQALKHLT